MAKVYFTNLIIVTHLIICVRNNKWWICPFPNWGEWQMSTLEIIPIPLNTYYPSFVSHPSILKDDGSFASTAWSYGPSNVTNDSYAVYDSSGKQTVIPTIPTASS